MTTKELMLNDIVTFKDCLEDNRTLSVQIVAIGYQHKSDNEILASIDSDEACDIIEVDDEVVGIPITPKILQVNGFLMAENAINDFSIAEDYYDISIKEWSDSIWVFKYECVEMNLPSTQVVISYVHELQHALRLCGLADLADNFKV